MKHLLSRLSTLGLLLALPAATAIPEEARFDPARHFPLECLAYLHVPSGRELVAALGETLPARVGQDPEVIAALGRLPEVAREFILEAARPFQQATGRDPISFLRLFSGEISLSVTGIDPVAKLSVLVALELGSEREAILDTVSHVSEHFARASGKEAVRRDFSGKQAVVLNFPGLPPVYSLVLGTHLVLGSSPDALGTVVEAFGQKDPDPDFSLGGNPRYREAAEGLKLGRPRLEFFLNLEALRAMGTTALQAAGEGGKQILKALNGSGITSFTLLGYSLGSRDGDVEARFLLGTGGGARGLLKDLLASLEDPGEASPALALAPAGSRSAGSVGVNFGRTFRAIHRFIREDLPAEIAEQVDGEIKVFLEGAGLSLEKDLFTLGKIALHLFEVEPAAGGLLPDLVVLARTEELQPYRSLVEKVAATLHRKPLVLAGPPGAGGAPGRSIHYLRIGGVFSRLLGQNLDPDLVDFEPPISVAHADLEGGFTLLSWTPQAVWRALSGAKRTGAEAGLAALRARAAADGKGAKAFVAFLPDTALLAGYNTLVLLTGVAGQIFQVQLAAFGVDPALLPPGEKFLPYAKEGFVRVDSSPKGLEIHTHRLFSSRTATWIPVIGIAASIGFYLAKTGSF